MALPQAITMKMFIDSCTMLSPSITRFFFPQKWILQWRSTDTLVRIGVTLRISAAREAEKHLREVY